MQQFTIKEVEKLSGIKAHTLRIWEQRYSIIKPLRKPGNHRFYSNDDLKKLLKVVYLNQGGHKIGEIARLSAAELDNLIQPEKGPGRLKDASFLQMTEAIMDFDETRLFEIINHLEARLGFETSIRDVVFPLLNRIGTLWMTNKMMPGQEHFASHIITCKLLEAIDKLPTPSKQQKGRVMLFTPQGEQHEMGLLFIAYLLKRNGFGTVYLGIGPSIDTIKEYYEVHHPSHLFLFMTSNLQEESPEDYLARLHPKFPKAEIVAAGPVIKMMEHAPPNCLLLKTEENMITFCSNPFFNLGN
jgi:MerR family transcriptional regulator, light-induced transcriptional regulator